MNKKTKISKYFLFFSVLTFIAILAFVIQSGYASLMRTGSVDKGEEIDTTPLDIKLNLDVIQDIKDTQEYTNQDLIVTPTQSPDLFATQSALVNE